MFPPTPRTPPFTLQDARNLAPPGPIDSQPLRATLTPSPSFSSKTKPGLVDSNPGWLVPGGAVIKYKSGIAEYLNKELGVEKINCIYQHLWWAGRRGNIRALHRQIMIHRNICITECPTLHLVWYDSTIYIKPMPEYLLDWEFFNKYICPDDELFQSACGFLTSYAKLIRHKSDLTLAISTGLLPARIDWDAWCSFVPSIQKIPHRDINKRYIYGELRLRRLNQIYNFCKCKLAYHSPYTQYDHYFRQNFAWLLLLFAYLTIVLTGMQVVLATPNATGLFKDASYWFGVGSIIIVLVGAIMLGVLFLSLFTYNLIITLFYQPKAEQLEEPAAHGDQYHDH
ncbi:hypothetical protein Q9L58_009971 [Maublancomyces gigas]|uniref:Uncharacterized protein n=1 Tax=Discina gigas TaxID=1032678 RepID=A0ABR3G5D4_9PEZI